MLGQQCARTTRFDTQAALEAPLKPRLAILQLPVLLCGHLRKATLAIIDRFCHARIQSVLEDALGNRAVQPRIDKPLGLPVALHCGDRVARFARTGAHVEVEHGRAIRWDGRRRALCALRIATLHALWHGWPALAPHRHNRAASRARGGHAAPTK